MPKSEGSLSLKLVAPKRLGHVLDVPKGLCGVVVMGINGLFDEGITNQATAFPPFNDMSGPGNAALEFQAGWGSSFFFLLLGSSVRAQILGHGLGAAKNQVEVSSNQIVMSLTSFSELGYLSPTNPNA